jgi:hypothetical protein
MLLLLPAVLLGEALCQMRPVLRCSAGVMDWFLLLVVLPVYWSAAGNLLVRLNERMFP